LATLSTQSSTVTRAISVPHYSRIVAIVIVAVVNDANMYDVCRRKASADQLFHGSSAFSFRQPPVSSQPVSQKLTLLKPWGDNKAL